MTGTTPRYTAEQLDHAAKHTLFNMTSKGQCVSLQDVVNRTIWNYGLDGVDRDLLYASIEKAVFASTALDGNIQYAVPDGHFDYMRLKPAEPVLPAAHNPLSITGYRHLTPEEIEQINRIKDAGAVLQALCAEVGDHISHQFNEAYQLKDDAGADRLQEADPNRWFYEGRQKLQDGLMCLTRAIAQPSSF